MASPDYDEEKSVDVVAPTDTTRRLEFAEELPYRQRNANLAMYKAQTDEISSTPRKRNAALALFPTKSVRSIMSVDGLSTVETRKTNAARVPAEFRTLSIHVYDSQFHDGKDSKTRKDKGKGENDSDFFARLDYHTAPVESILQRFSVSPKVGLEDSSIQRLTERHGKNVLVQRRPNYFKKLFCWYFGGFCSILWAGAIIFFLCWKPLGNPNPQIYNLALGCVLIGVVLIQGTTTALQDWSTQRVMSSILSLLPENASVLRNGQHINVSPADLVPGDIVTLTSGNKVPADMRIIEASSDVRFDRAVLTGETEEVKGTSQDSEVNFLESKAIAFLGSHITNGKATCVVVLTGANTVMGRINKLTNSGKTKTTLIQREINRFVIIIITLTLSLIAIMAITWAAWLRKDHAAFLPVTAFLSNLVGLIVAFTPEGMPMCVALTLTLIAGRMKRANVLPKSLTTVETLGCVNVICSDKTGTLTENRMTVVGVGSVDQEYTSAQVRDLTSSTANPTERIMLSNFGKQLGICNDAIFEQDTVLSEKIMVSDIKTRPANGNATDVAILRFSDSLASVEESRRQNPRIAFIAFNSRNKWMMTAIKAENGDFDVIFKGAPDILIASCTSYLNSANEQKEFGEKANKKVADLQEKWSRQGQRVLVLAFKRMQLSDDILNSPAHDETIAKMALAEGLCFVGLVGITDPPRAEIPRTVADCRRAGLRFHIVTGDFKLTAAAIAQQCGILTSNSPYEVSTMAKAETQDGSQWLHGGLVIQGSEIDKLSDEEWSTVCQFEEVVFARTTPEQKLRIVQQFQQRAAIVGVTGDGVNDAAALKSADVGIALAGGSDVAIEAADLVLMGSFSAILTGIQKGRLVFQNLQKVIAYLLPAGSYSEDWPVVLNVFLGVPLPLSAFLMVIICCFTDLACCLSLIMEEEEYDLLSLPPRDAKHDHLINMKVYGQAYLFMGTMQTVCAHSMFFLYMYRASGIPVGQLFLAYEKYSEGFHGYTQAELNSFVSTGQCVYFVALVVMQWFNLLTVRNKRLSIFQANPFTNGARGRQNLWLFAGMVTALLIAIFVTEVGGMNRIFGTARVPIEYWLIPIPLGLGILLMDELRKLAVRTWPNGIIARISW